MPSSTEQVNSSQSMDLTSLITIGGFSTATLSITGLITKPMSADQVENFGALIAFGIALIFSGVQAGYMKLFVTKGGLWPS